jgi:hypothetical protein
MIGIGAGVNPGASGAAEAWARNGKEKRLICKKEETYYLDVAGLRKGKIMKCFAMAAAKTYAGVWVAIKAIIRWVSSRDAENLLP